MLINIWLSCKDIRNKFPEKGKVKVDWPGHMLNGCSGTVTGYNFFTKNGQYLLELNVTLWTSLGTVHHDIPWNHLVPI